MEVREVGVGVEVREVGVAPCRRLASASCCVFLRSEDSEFSTCWSSSISWFNCAVLDACCERVL